MKLTNKYGLPSIYVRAVENSTYDHGTPTTFGVTTLLAPPQAVELNRVHNAEMEEDVTDRLFALQGTMRHLLLERAAVKDDLVEYVVSKTFHDDRGGVYIVRGHIDHIGYDNGQHIMSDYKNTSVFKVKRMLKEGISDEWAWQLNMYRWLYEQDPVKGNIDQLQIICESRDWRRSEAKYSIDFPQQVEVFNVPIYDDDQVENHIFERLKLHVDQRFFDGQVQCTDDERWYVPPKFAVKKKGNKKASKLFEDKLEAYRYAAELTSAAGTKKDGTPKAEYDIEIRNSSYPRCEDYCSAAPFCSQWKQTQENDDG